MKRRIAPLRFLPALLGLLVLAAIPAAQAAETLVLSCHVCNAVVATGKGLPANSTVRVTVTDVRTGQRLRSLAIRTDAEGVFTRSIAVDLSKHQSVESTVYKSSGSVLVVAAHNRFDAPCKNGKIVDAELREKTETGAGERAAAEDHLAFTGAHAPQFLGVGSGLLAAGIVLLLATRRQRARA